MHILQLVVSLDCGGLERVVTDLTHELSARGHRVSPAFLSHPGAFSETLDPITQWCGNVDSSLRSFSPLALFNLVRFIRRNRVDVIHSHNPAVLAYGLAAGLLTRTSHVHSVHGRGTQGETGRSLKSRLRRMACRLGVRFTAVSRDCIHRLTVVDGLPVAKLYLVTNGIDTMRWLPPEPDARRRSRRRYRWNDDHLVIGTVGRLSKAKNYPMLIDSFRTMIKRRNMDQARLLLVGDGSERQALEHQVSRADLGDKVVFTGERRDVIPELHAMDLFCLSSDTEGTPMTLLEAGACGLPAVVTAVGGNPEVIAAGETGLVVPPNDPDNFSLALARLAENAALRRAMGAAARERIAARYSLAAMTEAYIDLYDNNLCGAR